MARGAAAARQKHLVTVTEIEPGVFDYGGVPILGIDLNTDGGGMDFLQRYAEHQPDGFNSATGVSLVGDEGQFQGNFMPHYEMMVVRLRAICGQPVVSVLPDGRTKYVFKLPELGRVDRETFSGYYGAEELAYELLYGKITALSMDSVRSGDVSGSMTMHFNRVRRGQPMLGTVASNAKFTVTQAAGAVDDLVLDISVNGGAAQQLTIEPDAVAADVQTDFLALSNITTGTVTLDGGVYSFEVTGPANTRVGAYKVSGGGWTVRNTVYGSNGASLLDMAEGAYIESVHGLFYYAEDAADLASINMGNADGYPADEPHIVPLQAHSFSLDGLVNPLYMEDRSTNPTSHVDGETNITATYTLPEDTAMAETLFASVDGCAVTPFYGRQAWRCGEREFWFDLYGSRNAAPESNTDQNVAGWSFTQRRIYNPAGSAVFTVILP